MSLLTWALELARTSEKLFPQNNSQQDCLRYRLASAVALIVALSVSLNVFAGTRCGPFGDPPAQVDRGWYASFVTARNSICLGGELLGPWTDGNGDARYACLYEPARAGEREPLPMLVFLHPSETSAYSVILTGLVGLIDKGVLKEGNPGFILLAPQGRYTTHLYPGYDSNALGWDNWYRQLSTVGAVAVGDATLRRKCGRSFDRSFRRRNDRHGQSRSSADLCDGLVQRRRHGAAIRIESAGGGSCGRLFRARPLLRALRCVHPDPGGGGSGGGWPGAGSQSTSTADACAQRLRHRRDLSERQQIRGPCARARRQHRGRYRRFVGIAGTFLRRLMRHR